MNQEQRHLDSLTPDGRYRLLVEAISDYAIYMLDTDGIITSWNPGAQRFKGYSETEMIGQHFSRFYTPEDRQTGLPARALKTAATEGRFESEGWRVRKDGSRFWAYVIIDPVRLPNGELIGYAKVTRDLTERRATEAALRRSEQQLATLIQGVTDYAIYMLDRDGRVASWNQGAQRIKGYRPEEIIGEHFSRFYTDEDRTAGVPFRGLETAAREGRFENEGWRVRKDGTQFWASVVIDTIHDDNGAIAGFAKITRDMTEKRATQQALEKAREALFQSQKLEAIGQLTGGIAHDFNNLLMAILGSLDLVRKRLAFNPRVTPLLENAIHGAQRGASLTQRMLAFARRQDLDLKPVDLGSLVNGMLDLTQRSLGPTIAIDVDIPSQLPPVTTDPAQLESALLNLAVNARDAMPRGGMIRIRARAETLERLPNETINTGQYVHISVSDEGEGMDEQTLARATEPFFTTKGAGKGTGLGLPMVQGLTAQSGGRLTVKSQKGHGTTVDMWLPVASASQHDRSVTPDADTPASDRPLSIMVVDDDPLVRMNMVAMLEDIGHRIVAAASGSQAIELIETEPDLDLVVTDHAMPRMTGAELADRIRQKRPHLPILLATGYAELPPGVGEDLPRLAKPFLQAELAQAVRLAAAVPAGEK